MSRWVVCLFFVMAILRAEETSHLSAAAVGWGNLLVPGLGATLRKRPYQGLLEASTEIGLFYGGTFGVRESNFTIDSTIILPQKGSLIPALIGQTLQQMGLKMHMYMTFYHYQQQTIELESQGIVSDNPQKLYRGSTWDVLSAPFRWKNLSNDWVYPFLLLSACYLAYDYRTTKVKRVGFTANSTEDALYGAYNIGFQPMGSAYGEEPLFRGFLQREFRGYTRSRFFSILLQSTLFTLLHPGEDVIPAFFGGAYFGYVVDHFDGDIELTIAAHFWLNVMSGLVSFFRFEKAHGDTPPFSPPLGLVLSLPL